MASLKHCGILWTVAIGTGVVSSPPRRSVCAKLPHMAPTSGSWRRGVGRRFTHTLSSERHASPGLSPARGPEARVPLGWSPSLHRLRQPHAFVRRLLWYYATVRLPASVHAGRTAQGLFRPTFRPIGGRCPRDLPVPVRRVSTHAQSLRLRGIHGRLALSAARGVAFRLG